MRGVDCWGKERNAIFYTGPHPVVAHPPCQLWVNLAAVNFKRYGGEHNRPGNDGGLFEHALVNVLTHGGVLEHPAFSLAWRYFKLQPPQRAGWNYGWATSLSDNHIWTCEVWQSAYGHRARKRTWLLYAGERDPFELNWRRKAGTHQCGWFDRIKPTLSKREANETPLAFARELVRLARHSRKPT